ncbi:MAG: hypothetical protein IKP09_08500 [Lentisphaeria bacterium]|nr:hypothetical protein [Lentisphaeria bacterium]
MNPETPQAMNPQTEPPMTEPPRTAVPAPETPPGEPKKHSGLLGMFLDAWADRDLDMDNRDTSDWNIYYYYYRHIYQKRATVKLTYLRWIALLFQILYFLGQLLGLALLLITALRKGKTDLSDLLIPALSLGSAFGLQYFILLFPFLPVIMVSPAFKLRAKKQGLMTSRASEQPLLAHLVQYTTDRGLVTGALQSLLFTWRKFFLLLLPCILESVLLLTCYALFFADSPHQIVLSLGVPLGTVLIILTLSVCVLMLSFCLRLDSLLVMILIGILAFATVIGSGIFIREAEDGDLATFWGLLLGGYIPACLLGSLYFTLAAADTNEYGLGRASRKVRALLFSLAGVFLALILSWDLTSRFAGALEPYKDLFGMLFKVFIWGLYACVCCLLVTSISFTSHKAALLRRDRKHRVSLLGLFDPASPVSLFPVFALEVLSIAVVRFATGPFLESIFPGGVSAIRIWYMFAVVSWTVLHIALGCTFLRRKPEIREPWNSHGTFNVLIIFFAVIILLILSLLENAATGIATCLFGFSILIGVFLVRGGSYADDAVSAAPAGGVPAQGHDKEAL